MQRGIKCQRKATMNDYADSGFLASKAVAMCDSLSSCPLSILPSEVLECVLRFCDAETLAAISQTCSD